MADDRITWEDVEHHLAETRVCLCGETIEPAGSAWIGATDGWETCLGTEDFHEPADDPNYLPAVIRYLAEETT